MILPTEGARVLVQIRTESHDIAESEIPGSVCVGHCYRFLVYSGLLDLSLMCFGLSWWSNTLMKPFYFYFSTKKRAYYSIYSTV